MEKYNGAENGLTEKGLLCGILESKPLGNRSNGGISSKVGWVILLGEGIPTIIPPDKNAPAVKLIRKNVLGSEYLYCEPLEAPAVGYTGWMASGSYITSSDDRFPSKYPIPLHDRQECPEDFKNLSDCVFQTPISLC